MTMRIQMRDLWEGKRPLLLPSVHFSSNLRVLALAPHPDDFDAVGVTMRMFRQNGNAIHVIVVCSSPGGVEDSFCSAPTAETKAAIREKEQRESCKFFGLPPTHLIFLRLREDEEGFLAETEVNFARIKQCLMEVRPDLVFLPHGNDTNLGHRRTCEMARRTALEAGRPITAFLNRDPKTIDMQLDAYTPFGEQEAQWKAKLLRCHRSQHQRNLNTRGHGFDDRILNVDRENAQKSLGLDGYAEIFELQRWGHV